MAAIFSLNRYSLGFNVAFGHNRMQLAIKEEFNLDEKLNFFTALENG